MFLLVEWMVRHGVREVAIGQSSQPPGADRAFLRSRKSCGEENPRERRPFVRPAAGHHRTRKVDVSDGCCRSARWPTIRFDDDVANDVSTTLGGRTGPRRPPLKWAGGKRWLVPQLAEVWEGHRDRRLVEPFCGGLAVSLGLLPDQALLNDSNPHLINFYRCLQHGLTLDNALKNDEEWYYRSREHFNRLISTGRDASTEAAILFYYLNRTGYNGLCRFNKRGLFNVPFGRYKRINYAADFLDLRPVVAEWEFTTGDFQQLAVNPDDFVYADPPYDATFSSYSAGGFDWRDQQRLAQWLADHPGPVVASNQATPRILSLYGDLGFQMQLLEGPRRISSDGNRDPALEILAFRNVE